MNCRHAAKSVPALQAIAARDVHLAHCPAPWPVPPLEPPTEGELGGAPASPCSPAAGGELSPGACVPPPGGGGAVAVVVVSVVGVLWVSGVLVWVVSVLEVV